MAQLAVTSVGQPPPAPSKRRRLNTLLDKLTLGAGREHVPPAAIEASSILTEQSTLAPPVPTESRTVVPLMFARAESEARPGDEGPAMPPARSPRAISSDVFRFDSLDRERFACRAISEEGRRRLLPGLVTVDAFVSGQSVRGSGLAEARSQPAACEGGAGLGDGGEAGAALPRRRLTSSAACGRL